MNGKRILTIMALTAVFGLAGWTDRVFAQGNTWVGANLAQMVEAARWNLGGVRLNAAFTLSNAGYDSDIYYGYLDETTSDFTLTAGMPVQALLPLSKKVVLDLADTPSYQFYVDTKKERAWNNTFRGQLHFALDKLYIRAGGGTSDNKTRLSRELDINIRVKRDDLNAMVLWQLSKAASLAALYSGVNYDYGDAVFLEESIAGRLNRNEDYFDMITYIQSSARTRIFLDGQHGIYAMTGPNPVFEDARSYSVFGGIEFLPRVGEVLEGVGIQGALKLGYTRFDVGDPDWIDGSGFTGEADISFEPMKRTTANVSFSRGFQFSFYSASGYYLSTAYGAGLSRLLSRKATLSYDFSVSRNSYPTSETEGPLNLYATHKVSLNLRLARHLNITLLGRLADRNFARGGAGRTHYFAGFSMTYGFSGGGMAAPSGGMTK